MPVERVVAVGKSDGSINENDPVRATDDVHVNKFKKHFQRKWSDLDKVTASNLQAKVDLSEDNRNEV